MDGAIARDEGSLRNHAITGSAVEADALDVHLVRNFPRLSTGTASGTPLSFNLMPPTASATSAASFRKTGLSSNISQTRTAPSSEPVATNLASGLNSAQVTNCSCRNGSLTAFPVSASHTRTVLSNDSVSTRKLLESTTRQASP